MQLRAAFPIEWGKQRARRGLSFRGAGGPTDGSSVGLVPIFQPAGLEGTIRRLQLGLLVVAAVAGALLAIVAAARGLASATETMFPEGALLQGILRVRDGQPLYVDYRLPPFNVTPYTPLYYLVAGLGARLIRLDLAATLALARSVSLLAGLGATLAVTLLARRCGASRAGAAIAAGLFGGSFVLHPWAYTARPDLLALAISLFGLWVGLRGPGRRGAVGAGLLLALAFLTKQTYLAALGALALAALGARRWDRALALVLAWGLAVGGAILLLQLATAGQLLPNVVSPHSQSSRPELLVGLTIKFLLLGMLLLVTALPGWRGTAADPAHRLVRWYVALGALYALSAAGKTGSNFNHFLQLVSGLAVLAAIGFDRLAAPAERPERLPPAPLRHPAGLPLVVGTALLLIGAALQLLTLGWQAARDTQRPPILAAIAAAPGQVLTEADSFAVVMAGKTAVAADPFEVALLADHSGWDPSPLVRMVDRGEFALIILNEPVDQPASFYGLPLWPPGVREAIRGAYREVGRLDGRYLYAPAS